MGYVSQYGNVSKQVVLTRTEGTTGMTGGHYHNIPVNGPFFMLVRPLYMTRFQPMHCMLAAQGQITAGYSCLVGVYV